jgi:hypothetical protein
MDYLIRKRLWNIENQLLHGKKLLLKDYSDLSEYLNANGDFIESVNWLKTKVEWADYLNVGKTI